MNFPQMIRFVFCLKIHVCCIARYAKNNYLDAFSLSLSLFLSLFLSLSLPKSTLHSSISRRLFLTSSSLKSNFHQHVSESPPPLPHRCFVSCTLIRRLCHWTFFHFLSSCFLSPNPLCTEVSAVTSKTLSLLPVSNQIFTCMCPTLPPPPPPRCSISCFV